MYKCRECKAVFEEPLRINGGMGICPNCKQAMYANAIECSTCGQYIFDDGTSLCEECLHELDLRLYGEFREIFKELSRDELRYGIDSIENALARALDMTMLEKRG